VASSDSSKKIIVDKDGVIPHTPNQQENRIIRFQRQSVSARLLKDKRVGGCLRYRMAEYVKVLKSVTHGKCHFADLQVCGSVWDCPVCSAKISERRRTELARAVSQYKKVYGGQVLFVTFTYSHKKEDNLKELLTKQSKALAWFYRHRTYKNMRDKYHQDGRVRALEVNHGDVNGWQPHAHELWFIQVHLHDYETIKREVFDLWSKACEKFGLGAPSEKHGVDIRGGDDASNYIAKFGLEDKKIRKWGVEDELTKANSKKGRKGSRSPFELLDDYELGSEESGQLFVEYSKAFFRSRQLRWSKGLKAMFELEELTDEEIAVQKDDEAILLTEIFGKDWDKALRVYPRRDIRANILALGENGGADAIHRYISALLEKQKQLN